MSLTVSVGTETYLAKKTDSVAPTSALDGLLSDLSVVAEKARLGSVDACHVRNNNY